jgi:hypothetical protein
VSPKGLATIQMSLPVPKKSKLSPNAQLKYLKQYGIVRVGSYELKNYRIDRHRRGEPVRMTNGSLLKSVRKHSPKYTTFPYDLNYNNYRGHVFSIPMAVWRGIILPYLNLEDTFALLHTCKQWYELMHRELCRYSVRIIGPNATPMALYWYCMMEQHSMYAAFTAAIETPAHIKNGKSLNLNTGAKESVQKVIAKLGYIDNVKEYSRLMAVQYIAEQDEQNYVYNTALGKVDEFHAILDRYQFEMVRICIERIDSKRMDWKFCHSNVEKVISSLVLKAAHDFWTPMRKWLFQEDDIDMNAICADTLRSNDIIRDLLTYTISEPLERFKTNWIFSSVTPGIRKLMTTLLTTVPPPMIFDQYLTTEQCCALIRHILSNDFYIVTPHQANYTVYKYVVWDSELKHPKLWSCSRLNGLRILNRVQSNERAYNYWIGDGLTHQVCFERDFTGNDQYPSNAHEITSSEHVDYNSILHIRIIK